VTKAVFILVFDHQRGSTIEGNWRSVNKEIMIGKVTVKCADIQALG